MKSTHWIAAGAVAAMFAAASPALKAQDSTTSTDLNSIPVIAPVAPIDYSVLRNQAFTYTDLQQARYSGLSEDQVATVAKVAEETGAPFSEVRQELYDGVTFPQMALKYNLSLADLYNVDDEKAKIENYKQAYRTTGTYALRAMNNGDMMSSDMSSGSGSMASSGTSSSSMSSGSGSTASGSMSTGTSTSSTSADTSAATGDVVDVAMATPQLSTLVKAIQAAGLVDTLKGAGPFTIFAPSNRAFSRLPKAQLNALLADPTALKNVLTYHVIAGQKIDAAAAMSMTSPTSPPTVQGGTLQVVTTGGHVMVNNATVVRPDIQATNGIIHIIDRVLMPPAATP